MLQSAQERRVEKVSIRIGLFTKHSLADRLTGEVWTQSCDLWFMQTIPR